MPPLSGVLQFTQPCRRQLPRSTRTVLTQNLATHEGGASFVQRPPSDSDQKGKAKSKRGASFMQRTPSDSEKRANIPCECGVASWHKTVPRGTAKRVGGRAKTWGVWGVSPHMGGKAPHMQNINYPRWHRVSAPPPGQMQGGLGRGLPPT